jgi:hypothetical protein
LGAAVSNIFAAPILQIFGYKNKSNIGLCLLSSLLFNSRGSVFGQGRTVTLSVANAANIPFMPLGPISGWRPKRTASHEGVN